MRARKGFTLVEMLIVIVIIGILASAVILSGRYVIDLAEYNKIVTNLSALKNASLMVYNDSMDLLTDANAASPTNAEILAAMAQTMERPGEITSPPYAFAASDDGRWWVGYNAAGRNTGIQERLAAKANELGLVTGSATVPAVGTHYAAAAGAWVWMPAR